MPLTRALVVSLALLFAGCGEGDPSPLEDGGADVDRAPTDGLAPAVSVYEGTCLQELAECFDLSTPCMQENLEGMPGFVALSDSGAMLTINLAEGTQLAINSAGQDCFTSSVDPATEETFYVAGEQTYRERVVGSERRITCPDGSQQTAPAGMSPWEMVVNLCSAP